MQKKEKKGNSKKENNLTCVPWLGLGLKKEVI
jgi:hypothetical protein